MFNIEYSTIKTNKKIEYINIECAFDIETTSTLIDGEKFAFMYAWGFGLKDENHLYYGRTWEELLNLLTQLSNEWGLGKDRRLICYVHNLGYEFQFMRKYFNWLDVFSAQERKPMKALCDLGIEFRDSLILSGMSLENTAKNLTNHTIKKLTGDLDYSLIRHEETPLTNEEWGYIENDIVILLYYINEQIEIYKDISKIPLTNTGRVRAFVKNNCYYNNTSHKKSSSGKYNRYRKTMNELTLDPHEYTMLNRAFMGGFTHASSWKVDKTIENVHSIDFTSSYPSVMIAEKFPMSRGVEVDLDNLTEKQFKHYLENYACVMDIGFVNIRNKIHYESYLSQSKCEIRGSKLIDNGRVYKAEKLITTITEIDFNIIQQVYEWDSLLVNRMIVYKKGYLPIPIIKSVIELYQDKTVLKGVEGKETEYLLSKGMLNSIYGMTVTAVTRDEITYDDDWDTQEGDTQDQIEKYNNSRGRFLFYAWGVWITAYARKNLWLGILNFKDDYIYSDTDSIKFLNYEKHEGFINAYNEEVTRKIETTLSECNIDIELARPKTKEGAEKPLGVWDYEGNYSRFKTLGAKRYLVEENGKLELTVAGLSKQSVNYIEQQGGFDFFNNEMYIPSEHTSKLTHSYDDNERTETITDYTGATKQVNSKSFIHLEPTEFTLNITDVYIKMYKNAQRGYYGGII